jgi:hypothetical protein
MAEQPKETQPHSDRGFSNNPRSSLASAGVDKNLAHRACPRHQHSRQHPCLPHDPKSLTATSTQGRSVGIRHASRENGSFH